MRRPVEVRQNASGRRSAFLPVRGGPAMAFAPPSRREFLRVSGAGIGFTQALRAAATVAGVGLGFRPGVGFDVEASAQERGDRPTPAPPGVSILNPRGRVPVSLIIDDSTCLVNLAHFCIPQFAEVFPDQYRQPWKTLPREIPDAFVRKFGEWCQDRAIKGKYSIIPYPACVGWLDRDLPGWSRRELEASLELVRTLMVPNWDIHPEMVSHTWVVDTKTGRPLEDRTERSMENWGWSAGKSADQLTEYLSYALRVLKNAGLPCEGVTTPGGFGTRALPELSQATLASCREVFGAEIPHYFRHLFTDEQSVAPRVEYATGLDGADPRCVVSMIGCTGDWFGGWDGLTPGSVDQFITADLKGGRLPQVIARDEPAILVCHWPGIYYNGEEVGFRIFQEVVKRLDEAYDHLSWMKLSEIARYWAARELTTIAQPVADRLAFRAPFACPGYTVKATISDSQAAQLRSIRVRHEERMTPLRRVEQPLLLESGTYRINGNEVIVCFDLPKGASEVDWSPSA
jgi:hypothetical protein